MRSATLVWGAFALLNGLVAASQPRHAVRSLGQPHEARAPAGNLQTVLSVNATISNNASTAPRWSAFKAPQPGTVVNVQTEQDVEATVQYCLENGLPFLAQNGGHGWIDSFHLYENGVLINMRGLNFTTFNEDKTVARVGGGAIIEEVIAQANASGVQVLTGNCNCVGALGADLGGGYGHLTGMYGFGVDNIISMNVVLANGSLVTVTPEDEDLWWALLGAGPNFGIVTSAEMNAYPMENTAWVGALTYTSDKIEQLASAIQNLTLEPRMNIFLFYGMEGTPGNYTPMVVVEPFYLGNASAGEAAFKSILDIGYESNTCAETPYAEWNVGGDWFCEEGGRKPSYGAGLMDMVPQTWLNIWDAFVNFTSNPGTHLTSVMVECYSLEVAQAKNWSTTSFANRDVRFNSFVIPWYNDSSLDPVAEEFGSYVRDQWRSTAGFPDSANRTYVNFGFGDETNQVVYWNSTNDLQKAKEKYDPDNIFNQWFNIQPAN